MTEQQTRPSLLLVILLTLAWVLPGLTGHDPWKQDETYIFGIVLHMWQSGDWIVPSNAGQPFMEKPPLYYWVATVFVSLTHRWLSWHDGARLTSGFFTLITLLFTALTGRLAWGAGNGRLAVLTLIACFGLLYESHIMITDVPMLTGYAIALYGTLLARRQPGWGGLWIGTGTGIGFLAKGLLIPGTLGVTLLLLPTLFRTWRNRHLAIALAVALMSVLPWLLIWPTLLWFRSHELFYQWFWLNNIGRFLGFSVAELGAQGSAMFWPRTLPWFAWPAWLLAGMTLWQQRRQFLHSAPLQLGLLSFVVYLAVMQASASARTAYGLPMLCGLTLLATPANMMTPRLQTMIDYFSRLVFIPAILLSWYVWLVLYRTGHSPEWQWLTRGLAPVFQPRVRPFELGMAILATVLLPVCWLKCRQQPGRGVISTAAHITVLWLVLNALWLPWIDNAKRYREVFEQAASQLPAGYTCVSGLQMGESTRPMFMYYLEIQNVRFSLGNDPRCTVIMIDQWGMQAPQVPDAWLLLWHGTRPQDDEEQFWLYEKNTPAPTRPSASGKH